MVANAMSGQALAISYSLALGRTCKLLMLSPCVLVMSSSTSKRNEEGNQKVLSPLVQKALMFYLFRKL